MKPFFPLSHPMNGLPRFSIVTAGMIGPGKRWEHIPLRRNGKPIKQQMHVTTGDTVVVIAGDDKGQVGDVLAVYPKTGRLRVKGVNKVTKHVKPIREGESGKIYKSEGVLHQSNVMHWSKEKQVG